MSIRYIGGFITATYNPVVSPYYGVWTPQSQMQAVAAGTWTGLSGLYIWGDNSQGQLGLGNTTNYSSPKQVGGPWFSVSGGNSQTLATKTNGTLWSWGNNNFGQLGLGNTTNYSSPKQVGALTTWLNIAAGQYHTLATKTDGTLWAWGRNDSGQLGLGNTTYAFSSPVQVGALTTWSKITGSISFSLAIKTDGTLWSWGANASGQLGLGNITNRSSPVQVGALTTWSNVSANAYFFIASKTDGTLWSCGANGSGQLGLGDITNRSSPVQVGALTTWSSIAAGNAYGLAIKTGGTLWSWGGNGSGQLGLGDITNRSSPVQVGALTTWSKVSASTTPHSLSIKTDGTLWSWGANNDGQLGLGNTTYRSSPNQVGALTTWSSLSSGYGPRAAFNIS